MKKPAILLLLGLPAMAQFTSTARHIAPGASLPATCQPGTGDVFFKTSATVTPYYCSAANTWSIMGAAAGATPASPANSIQFNNAGAFGGSANLTWNNATGTFTIGTTLSPVGRVTVLGTTTAPDAQVLWAGPPSSTLGGDIQYFAGIARNVAVAHNPVDISNGESYGFLAGSETSLTDGTYIYGLGGFATALSGAVSSALFAGISSGINTEFGSSVGDVYGTYDQNIIKGAITNLYGNRVQNFINGGFGGAGVSGNVYGYYTNSSLPNGGVLSGTNFGYWAAAQGGIGANSYPFWADERGVFRIKADNTFDSVYQAIPALYNPQFAQYTPGLANYERIVEQWNGNVAEIGTEKGGTGTLRAMRFLGPSVEAVSYKTNTNCASAASPAVCAAAPAGAVAIPTGVTSVALVVNTTAVTANSRITLASDDSLTIPATTCNSTLATLVGGLAVTARTAGTSFTITYNGTIATNPLCVSYSIVN